jgi:hypothetical protein
MLSYFASRQDYWEADYRSATTRDPENPSGDEDSDTGRAWWKAPLGTRIRGGF